MRAAQSARRASWQAKAGACVCGQPPSKYTENTLADVDGGQLTASETTGQGLQRQPLAAAAGEHVARRRQ